MAPHVLHMTATPIPRTLSLTAYGDLDTTALHELPAGRQPVDDPAGRGGAARAKPSSSCARRLREGRQAFVVCPLVTESEKQPGKAAEVEAERLRAGELREFRVGLLHGQMHSAEKAEAMRAFAAQRDRRAGLDDGDRGRDRRRQRDGDDRSRGPSASASPSCTSCAAGSAAASTRASACCSPKRRASWRASGWGRWSRAATASSWPRSTSNCAARGRSSAPASRGLPRFAVAKLPEDGAVLLEARARGAGRCCAATAPSPIPPSARCSTPPTAASAPAPPTRSPSDRRSSFVAYRATKDERRLGCRSARDRRRAQGPAPGRAARLEGAADLRPRPRGDLLGARRAGRGRPRPRPLLRHRGAGDRGALARRRGGRPRRPRHPARRSATSSASASSERAELVRADAGRWLGEVSSGPCAGKFDLVFVDAPYRLADRVAQDLNTHLPHLLAEGGRAVVESGARRPLRIDSLEPLRQRRYGAADVSIYGRRAE